MSQWKTWPELKEEFHLIRKDKPVFDKILEIIPDHLEIKILQQPTRQWWKDWAWKFLKPLIKGEAAHLYHALVEEEISCSKFNNRWSITSTSFKWTQRFRKIWKAPLEPKKVIFAWSLLQQGLATKERLSRMSLGDNRCPFCNRPESIKHLFWFCTRARTLWSWVKTFTSTVAFHSFSWTAALLGDNRPWSVTFSTGWQLLRIEVLFCIWKLRNSVIFKNEFTFSLADCISSILTNCAMQIKVQTEKVQLELQHLLELINHWGAAPCSTSRVPPDEEQPRGRSRDRPGSRHSLSRGGRHRSTSAPVPPRNRPHSSQRLPYQPPPPRTGTWDSAPPATHFDYGPPSQQRQVEPRPRPQAGSTSWGSAPAAMDAEPGGWDTDRENPAKRDVWQKSNWVEGP